MSTQRTALMSRNTTSRCYRLGVCSATFKTGESGWKNWRLRGILKMKHPTREQTRSRIFVIEGVIYLLSYRKRFFDSLRFNLIYSCFWTLWMNTRLRTTRRLSAQMSRWREFSWLFFCIWCTEWIWFPWERVLR